MFVFESSLSLQFSTLMEACLQKFWIASRCRNKSVYKMATFECTNRHGTTWIFQLIQLQKSNRILLSASLICYKSISYCLHILSWKLRWRKKNCIIWRFCCKCHGKEFTPQQQKLCFIYPKTVCLYSFIHKQTNTDSRLNTVFQ